MWKRCCVFLTSALYAASLTSCTRGDATPIGSVHYPAATEAHVDILIHPPKEKYEEIGLVRASGAHLASREAVFRKLKGEAAKLGADAVIVTYANREAYGYLPGETYTTATGSSSGYLSGNNYYGNGSYNAQTYTTPGTVLSGDVATGVAIKYKSKSAN